MIKKLIAIAFFGVFASLLEACFCGESHPYLDYHKLVILHDENVGQDSLQVFYALEDSVEYLASVYQPVVTQAAFGTSCSTPGELGPKYALSNFEIFADKSFNDTLPAGKSLTSIFHALGEPDLTKNILQSMRENTIAPVASPWFYTRVVPKDPSQVFELTMRITKDNGTVAEGKISGLQFK